MIRIEIEKKDGGGHTLEMHVKNENALEITFSVLYGAIMALEKIPEIDLERKRDREMLARAFLAMLEHAEPAEPEEPEENA